MRRAVARRDLSFLLSIQKGSKQMWAPLGPENVRKAILKSKERLCTKRGLVPESITDTIRKVAADIFRYSPIDTVLGSRFLPSGSAHLQASRREGGALSMFEALPHTTEGFIFQENRLGKLPSLVHTVDEWRQQTFDRAYTQALEHSGIVDESGFMPIYDVRFVHIFEPGKIRNISISDGFIATA